MSKYKYLILTDLDGTLLNDEGQLTQKTIDYVHSLNERDDILFSFSTGKCWRDAEWIYKVLKLKGFVSCNNGGYILNPHLNKSAINFFISDKFWEDLLSSSFMNEHLFGGEVFSDKGDFPFTLDDQMDLVKKLIDLKANVFGIK